MQHGHTNETGRTSSGSTVAPTESSIRLPPNARQPAATTAPT